MKKVAKFSKVSFEQFKKDFNKMIDGVSSDVYWYPRKDIIEVISEQNVPDSEHYEFTDEGIRSFYNSIELPKRATVGSAGHDFYLPFNITIPSKCSLTIPTGIRCEFLNSDYVLNIYPRSGLGFKYGIKLKNTVGIIDSDYYYSDNEGHIMVKLHNPEEERNAFDLNQGQAFCQGIFLPYGIADEEEVTNVRNGGFGSTSK